MKKAVVTGASSGIGLSIAKELSRRGYALVLVARREARLKEIADLLGNCQVFVADLEKKSECEKLEKFLENESVEVFVNNAGFGECGSFDNLELSREQSMIALNVMAFHQLTKMACSLLEKSGGGFLLNVASIAGLFPGGPFMSTYYASKAFAASYTQGVSFELKERKSNVFVSCLCPGPVNTEFNSVAHVQFALKGISADYCACYAIKKMFQKKSVIVPNLMLKFGLFFSRFMPRKILVWILAQQQKRKLG